MGSVNPTKSNTLAIKDVTIIPMDSERTLEDQTCIVKRGRIAAIGPKDKVQIPADAEVIEGVGAYLLPGLANMHAHLVDFDPDPEHMILYLAGGVTTVRSLNTPWKALQWREKVVSGEWLGPTILLSGPTIVGIPREYRKVALGFRTAIVLGLIVSGALLFGLVFGATWLLAGDTAAESFVRSWGWVWFLVTVIAALVAVWRKLIPLTQLFARIIPQAAVVETPAQARAEVRRQARAGVDLVKVYDYLSRDSYFAALAAAREAGIYAAGHIPDDPEVVSTEEALQAGLNEVVHTDEFTNEFLKDYTPGIQEWVEWEIDMDRIDDVARIVSERKTAVTATLVTGETVLLGLEDSEELFSRPEYRFIQPEIIDKWRSGGRLVNWQGQEKYRRESVRPLWMQLTRTLHEMGVPILLGTDTGVEGIVPGRSEHKELALLVESGLTPFEALAGASRDAAMITKRMGADGDWGTIAVGNRADLILIAENPLEDITNTEKMLGVMVRGAWYGKTELDQRVAEYLGHGQAPAQV